MSYHDYCKNIQNLMSIAYKRWQADREMSKETFMSQLSASEAVAVRIGNMNYQVENGGWPQYWGNSYATQETVIEVKGYLKHILAFARTTSDPRGAAAETVLRLYTQFDEALGGCYDPSKYQYSNSGAYYGDDEQEEEEDCGPQVDHLSSPYYDVNEAFMELAEDWLVATYVMPPLPAPEPVAATA